MVTSILSAVDKKRGPSKAVSFPEDESQMSSVVAEVPNCFEFSDDTRHALYFSRSDYHFSRSSARVVAKESERYGHSRHLDGSYISSFHQEVQDSMNIWCLHGQSRRGLERWANSGHGQARKDDQRVYIQGVLRAQSEMKLKEQYSDERLREVGHILSRKSRLFAKMLGEADSHAAKWELGMVDAMGAMSPRQRRKNLGLSASKVPAAMPPVRSPGLGGARRSSTKAPKQITIRTKSGRVPRMA